MQFPEAEELKTLVHTHFRDAKGSPEANRCAWSQQLTPPFPDPWPSPQCAVVFAYATALPIDLTSARPVITCYDGAIVARPFAAIYLRESEGPEVVVLATALTSAGVQGIRPANGAEIELMRRSGEVFTELGQLPVTLSPLVQNFYRAWANVSGVIARCLPAPQQRFLADIKSCLAQNR